MHVTEEQYEPFRLQASGRRMVEEPRHDLPEPLSFSAPPTSDISAIDRLTDGGTLCFVHFLATIMH